MRREQILTVIGWFALLRVARGVVLPLGVRRPLSQVLLPLPPCTLLGGAVKEPCERCGACVS